jgi:hypothetical protein
VIPIAESRALDQGEATLISLEIYDDGSILNFFAVSRQEDRPKPMTTEETIALASMAREIIDSGDKQRLAEFVRDRGTTSFSEFFGNRFAVRIQDDLGTGYSPPLWGRAGGGEVWRGSFSYTPTVPPEASHLRLSLMAGNTQLSAPPITIALKDSGVSAASPPS